MALPQGLFYTSALRGATLFGLQLLLASNLLIPIQCTNSFSGSEIGKRMLGEGLQEEKVPSPFDPDLLGTADRIRSN
jgi:hypothetical protein